VTGNGTGFGTRLAACRRSAGLSQEELADRAGLSVRGISNLELGRSALPHPGTVLRLADALGLQDDSRESFLAAAGRRLGGGAAGAMSAERPARAEAGFLRVVPRQLPAAVAHFAGRAPELAVLERAAGDESGATVVISAIGGMAGVGKTALALRWAHQAAGRFPDGQLYVDLRGYDPAGDPADAGEVIGRFLGDLGVATEGIPAALDARTALYRSVLAGRRVLIVADNARDAGQVRPLLPGTPGSLLLATTRGPLSGLAALDDACVVNLDVPTAAEAAELLSVRLGAARVAVEPQAAAELIRLCGRLPLALAIVAARAAVSGWPLAALAAELADETRRLGALRLGEAHADIRAVFSWSYQQLSPAAARMFRLLGLHPGPDISAHTAASLAGVPPAHTQAALRELADVSLTSERVPGRHALHDLLRAYAADQARDCDTARDRRAAVCRMLDHYLHTASSAARFLDQAEDTLPPRAPEIGVTPEAISDRGQALGWFGAEHKNLIAATRLAAEPGFDEHARQLPRVLTAFLDGAGHWDDLVACQHIALASAQGLEDLAGQASSHHMIGHAYLRLGQTSLARACLEQAIELSRRLDDNVTQACAHLDLSVVLERESQLPGALSSSQRALTLAKVSGDPVLQARASNNVGYGYATLGNPAQGLAYCQQSLELYRQVSRPSLEAHTWDSLGYIYRQLGDYQQSAASYQHAIGLFSDAGARYPSAQSLIELGHTHTAAGDTQAARSTWQQALVILDDLASPDASQIRSRLNDLGSRTTTPRNDHPQQHAGH
jgi:tetratricopeptide (TPR) repeat protein/transcriptional regulator with XRE-family HTH domain